MKRLLTVVVVGLVFLVSGCAGIPNSSSPQAIGTVDRPAPPNLPKPAPGMDPDVLLREFLKATADPANRHLAARQFLTESASSSWDDAGSALLIDNVVFVETPDAGRAVAKGDSFAVVESVKAASDVYAPVDGEVTEANEALSADPALVNSAATGDGWLWKMKLSDTSQLDGLMDEAAYNAHIG